jgi:hypothetical protein
MFSALCHQGNETGVTTNTNLFELLCYAMCFTVPPVGDVVPWMLYRIYNPTNLLIISVRFGSHFGGYWPQRHSAHHDTLYPKARASVDGQASDLW